MGSKGPQRPKTRHILPNGMWVCLYDDGTVKITGYDIHLELTHLANWGDGPTGNGGADVYLRRKQLKDNVRKPVVQGTDWVSAPK